MKKKLFCIFLLFFLMLPVATFASEALLSEADRAEIAAIKAHNAAQEKNKVSLIDYHNNYSGKREEKSEAYWDLAWHAKLADYGDGESQFIIAKAYETGRETEPNPKKALAFYQKSGDNGYIPACLRLAEIYRENKWVQADIEKEIYWYERAATLGHIQAQIKVSDMYQSGDTPNYQKSYDWLKIALQSLFPNDPDVEKHSPELQRLKGLIPREDVDE